QRFIFDMFVVAQVHADQARQFPHGFFECVETFIINDGDTYNRQLRYGSLQRRKIAFISLVHLRSSEYGWQVDAGVSNLRTYSSERLVRSADILAVDNRVSGPQHTQKRTTSAAIFTGTLDQPWDFYKLDEHSTDA